MGFPPTLEFFRQRMVDEGFSRWGRATVTRGAGVMPTLGVVARLRDRDCATS
jgi:hypothetical protein